MSEAVNPAGSTGSAEEAAAANATNAKATANKMSITVSTVAELKEKAPDVWNAIMQGIAVNMIGKMKRDADRLKEHIREGYQDA